MRISNSLLCGATLAVTARAASDAFMYTVDAGVLKPGSNQVEATSSSDAERILARRKGIDESHYMAVTDQSLLNDLNEFGGYQAPILGSSSQEHPAKLFIRISGYGGGVGDFNVLPSLWIEDAETDLLETFESKFEIDDICEYDIKSLKSDKIGFKYTYYSDSKPCLPKSEVENLPTMIVAQSAVPLPHQVSGRGISDFHRTLIHLAASDNVESTLLILPIHSSLKKSTPKSFKKTELRRRAESPLDLPNIPGLDITSDATTMKSNKSSNTTNPLPKVIPQYFTSLDSCKNMTNSCSGHGYCKKVHGNSYTCSCNSTIARTNKDGTTKSIKWGGNACQKKDVSAEFILFAGFGIFFTAVVVGGIGMMFSMGSQELPSVIGAGVVGPRAQR